MNCEKCGKKMKWATQRWIGKQAVPWTGWVCCLCEIFIEAGPAALNTHV